MSPREKGSEIVQSVVAVPVLLVMVFGIIQLGGMLVSIDRLSTDVERACKNLDTAGLSLADNKEAFLKRQISGQGTQLDPNLLEVSNISLIPQSSVKDQHARRPAEAHRDGRDQTDLIQKEQVVRVGFDLRYQLPAIVCLPGLMHEAIARHVQCDRTEEKVVEVRMNVL